MKQRHLLALGLGVLAGLHSCADREDALQSGLNLVGAWSDTYNEVADLAVGTDMLFVAANQRAGVLTFARGDEAAPFPRGGAPGIDSLYAPGDRSYISAAQVADRFLFLKLSTNLLAFDIRNPLQPRHVRTFFASGVNQVEALIEDGLVHLYYSDRSDGLSLHSFPLDTAGLAPGDPGRWFMNGDNPTSDYVSTFTAFENDGNDLEVEGDIIYLADGRFGLKVFQHQGARRPMRLAEIASLRLPGDALRIAVQDGLAAIAMGGDGLAVVDVSAPNRPYLRSVLKPGGTTLDVELGGRHAYLANSSRGVIVADLRDPARPLPRWQQSSSYARRIKLDGGRIYVADQIDGLLILDDPLAR
ncbi:MAG: hypothetical protein Q8O14_06875 [bacterium]|nr:hypothetical protein [bacterium]